MPSVLKVMTRAYHHLLRALPRQSLHPHHHLKMKRKERELRVWTAWMSLLWTAQLTGTWICFQFIFFSRCITPPLRLFWWHYCCFSDSLFFPLREKFSSGSLAGVKTGLCKIYIECILQSIFSYMNKYFVYRRVKLYIHADNSNR